MIEFTNSQKKLIEASLDEDPSELVNNRKLRQNGIYVVGGFALKAGDLGFLLRDPTNCQDEKLVKELITRKDGIKAITDGTTILYCRSSSRPLIYSGLGELLTSEGVGLNSILLLDSSVPNGTAIKMSIEEVKRNERAWVGSKNFIGYRSSLEHLDNSFRVGIPKGDNPSRCLYGATSKVLEILRGQTTSQ